ncbi:MAG TPA: PilZ domain-containing protein [Pyrinomonadaceae bacterium]|nr:PilZ domain-containing protein [Pyrinomonadaceae bacterium]
MWCPRCKSTRIQRGYNDSSIVFQMAGLHELLCNNCGLEFKGFDPLRRLKRAPAKHSEKRITDRRFPRYKVHLPAAISLVERNPLTWEVTYSPAARGHCEVISQGGVSLAFVGSRFREEELKLGCSLYVTINLSAAVIAAVVSAVTCERVSSNKPAKWKVGAAITQMSDADATKLVAYLEKRAKAELAYAYA